MVKIVSNITIMAITKSAKKALRQSERRRTRNVQKSRKLKSLLKEVKNLITQAPVKDEEGAKKLLSRVYKGLDKAAKTGLIKKNTASRKKSRISKALAKLNSSNK
ncbi:MAG: 30S ribosomal protein S20 [bacterium]